MKPIKVEKFRKFLKSIGLVCVRTKGSHEVWDKPDDSLERPIVFVTNLKEVPITHIKNNLKTLDMDIKDFEDKISEL